MESYEKEDLDLSYYFNKTRFFSIFFKLKSGHIFCGQN